MHYTTLPNTSIKVSKICLGTMTFGQQNTESEAHAQLDYAVGQGINFIDTAEMYPVAAREATYGSTEKFIGTWLKKTRKRNELVIATKIAGPNRGLPYIRENLSYDKQNIILSVEKSLQRLQTDYIDLYQLHWPERKVNFFGQRGYKAQEDAWQDNFAEILMTLQELIAQGKIRQVGVSNETPWGLMRFLEESKKHDLPKMITIQNAYSLVNRSFEINLSEVCHYENVGLLAYSPLAFGFLTGKYVNGQADNDSRLNQFPQFARYNSASTKEATEKYLEIATNFGLSLTEMALAFVQHQTFVTSIIVGATSIAQLEQDVRSHTVSLSEAVLEAIENVHKQIPDPAP